MRMTKWVKDKATGERIHIKLSRYNPEIHETLGEKPEIIVTKIDPNPYEKYSRQHLMKLAKEKGIKILITMKKPEIMNKLLEHDDSVNSTQ